MLLKVTLNFAFYCSVALVNGCADGEVRMSELEVQRINDSASEARIDSAYALIRNNCDTLMVHQVPRMVDSLLKDSALLKTFFDSTHPFTDADKKVEKVIRQLQADCDSNLLKETYRRARLQIQSKPVRRKRL